MRETLNSLADALVKNPGAHYTVGYCKANDDWVAQWFDGDHEAPALIAVADHHHSVLENLDDMIREELV